jgi:nucleotide-binding universal stress UspA family protein
MKTILVPTDFSKSANNAALYAVSLAKEMKASILLLHVYDIPMVVAGDLSAPLVTPSELKKESAHLLKKTAASLQKLSPVEIKCKVTTGATIDEILAEEKKASYIVMGMKGAGKLSELIIGSVTTGVLKRTKKPLLIVPVKAKFNRPKKIVLATDYDPTTNAKSFNALKRIKQIFNSKVFVVNVRNKKEGLGKENAVAEMKTESALKDKHHYYFYSEKTDLVDGINDFVNAKKADMIAIIPHKYTFFNNLFHKSVSKRMAFHTKLPLLALPDNHKSIAAYFI